MAHFKADAVYVTNDSPGAAWPSDIVTDMVAGLPPEVQNRYSQSSYPYLQVGVRRYHAASRAVPHWGGAGLGCRRGRRQRRACESARVPARSRAPAHPRL